MGIIVLASLTTWRLLDEEGPPVDNVQTLEWYLAYRLYNVTLAKGQ